MFSIKGTGKGVKYSGILKSRHVSVQMAISLSQVIFNLTS